MDIHRTGGAAAELRIEEVGSAEQSILEDADGGLTWLGFMKVGIIINWLDQDVKRQGYNIMVCVIWKIAPRSGLFPCFFLRRTID